MSVTAVTTTGLRRLRSEDLLEAPSQRRYPLRADVEHSALSGQNWRPLVPVAP